MTVHRLVSFVPAGIQPPICGPWGPRAKAVTALLAATLFAVLMSIGLPAIGLPEFPSWVETGLNGRSASLPTSPIPVGPQTANSGHQAQPPASMAECSAAMTWRPVALTIFLS